MKLKNVAFIVVALVILSSLLGYHYYQKVFGENITEDTILFVYSNESIDDVSEKLKDYTKDPEAFGWVADTKSFTKPKAGRYVLTKGMSSNDVVNLIRSGNQTPLQISFNNQDYIEKAVGRIAEQIEADSLSLLNAFRDSTFLSKNRFTSESVLQVLIPNTYEVYWTVSPENFRNRMLKEYHRFWNESRLAKAKAIKLSKEEVITLASIVHKETAKTEERPIVAGLYLNRLKKGWPLQADPTIIYVLKKAYGKDYEVKRVLNKDLKMISPYNTYLNKGLPPGPIGMPDISAIDAVLNFNKHNYYYMCADINKIGYHKFAETLSEHNRNAKVYQRWLTNKGVKR